MSRSVRRYTGEGGETLAAHGFRSNSKKALKASAQAYRKDTLLRQFRRQYPDERAEQIWQRIYCVAVSNYSAMSEHDQKQNRQALRQEYGGVGEPGSDAGTPCQRPREAVQQFRKALFGVIKCSKNSISHGLSGMAIVGCSCT